MGRTEAIQMIKVQGRLSLLHSRFQCHHAVPLSTNQWGGALRDETKNGCVADQGRLSLFLIIEQRSLVGNLDKLVFSNLSSKDVPLHNLEESFLTEIMEYWTILNHQNNLDFTSSQLDMVQLNQSSIILVHHRSEGLYI